jgi:hypothetical protein
VPPTISRFNLAVVWLSWAALVPFGWAFLDLSVLRAGMPGPAHPGGWSWLGFLVLNLAYLAAAAYTAPLALAPFLVSLSEHEIRFITIRGAGRMGWLSVEDVRVKGPLVVLRGGNHTVRLNEYCYAQPSDLLPFLRRVLPPQLRSCVAA